MREVVVREGGGGVEGGEGVGKEESGAARATALSVCTSFGAIGSCVGRVGGGVGRALLALALVPPRKVRQLLLVLLLARILPLLVKGSLELSQLHLELLHPSRPRCLTERVQPRVQRRRF